MPRRSESKHEIITGRGRTQRGADKELKRAREALVSKLNGQGPIKLPVLERRFTGEYSSKRQTRLGDGPGSFAISSYQSWEELDEISRRNIRRPNAYDVMYVVSETVKLTEAQARILCKGSRRQ